MSQLQVKLPTDTWVNATWEEYLQAIGFEIQNLGSRRIDHDQLLPDFATTTKALKLLGW